MQIHPATTTHPRAEALLDRIAGVVRGHLPPGVTPEYLDAFMTRHRPALVTVLERNLAGRDRRQLVAEASDAPPELWTAAKRTAANLRAMELAAAKHPDAMDAADRRVLAAYSGWGGLSIDKVADRFPAGFPAPEARGLIHEYYTPSTVCSEVARLVRPLLPQLAGDDGKVLTLEPSAGIGRFVRALSSPGFESLRWLTVEWSELSGRMLQAVRPDLALYLGPFERWVRDHGDEYQKRIKLIVANPPYGARGGAVADDPVRTYREKQAYAYFLRRGLDLLGEGGLGVFLIPSGFLSGRAARNRALRDKVLRRHHLAAAYRLPSVGPDGREAIFPGAMLVTDLLFFRARGGTLEAVDPSDEFILDGEYFEQFPTHVLGTEMGKDAGDDDQTAKPRWGYQIKGRFDGLPDLVERPLCTACRIIRDAKPSDEAPAKRGRGRVGVSRHMGTDTGKLSPHLASAVALGLRVDSFLSALASEDSKEPSLLWNELHEGLVAWSGANGNPWSDTKLRALVKTGVTGAERFLAAFTKAGALIPGLENKPVYRPRYTGRPGDVVAQAEMLYRQHRSITARELLAFHRQQGGKLTRETDVVEALTDEGWAVDWLDSRNTTVNLLPMPDYLSGHLWPRWARAQGRAQKGDGQAATQARQLVEVIAPAVFDDIEGVSPRQGWVPLDLVEGWLSEQLNARYGDVKLERAQGLVGVQGSEYERIGKSRELAPEARWCIGWINHDKTVFKPKKRRQDNIDEIRLAKAKEWDQSFRAWCAVEPERLASVEHAYNHAFRGFVAPSYAAEPLEMARWVKDGIRPHPWQVSGARRILANRGGLLAFDVGVGKTYAAIAVIARARQEGWVRRPVILVPNSIVWKWEADIKRVLPDYRVAIIGSKKKRMTRGARKGLFTSVTDSPQDRARKWTRFQAGEFDVVLLTYTALGRTRMNEASVREYAEKTEAIQREVKLRQRNAANSKRLSERQEAILTEGVAAWVAEQMELPESWQYDPGIAWDDIGIDMLIVDEAQNYKNLYLPEAREGGVPRFMGNSGTGSKRAWQLDFRTAAVRKHTGGAGIVLLSATPAKNSPLEFYNLIQFVDHEAWSRAGIRDPEQFIDRYLRIELKSVIDTKMDVVEKSAVTGFQNLHELRDTIFRYGEFKTADDVGLKLPEPQVKMVEVDMNAAQDAKYDHYVSKIEEALESDDPSDKAQILGLMARMALVAIHSELDEGYNWKTADSSGVDPHSPKLDAMAERVAANRTCGHIVFVDNVAAHRWAKAVLIESGIDPDRIAVLNATTAKASADRQRIARDFNGVPEEGIVPKYDVVIANAIAYEGIDLQTRTCAIHHLDLPWEPATLQQRNGRGVRQGNTLQTIEVNYYFALRSQDGLRFNLIQGKLGWMTELLRSQARDTNNPGAQMDLGPEEILLLISRDPEKTAKRLAEVKARREAEAKKKVAEDASRLLRSANARFRKAARTKDPSEAARLRLEAEARLEDLTQVDPAAWPWAKWMYAVRSSDMLVPIDGGAPVFEGLRIGRPNPWNPSRTDFAEFGRVVGTSVGVREVGSATWTPQTMEQVSALNLEPGHLEPEWPEDPRADQAIVEHIDQQLRYGGSFASLSWKLATDPWLTKVWQQHGSRIVKHLARARSWYAQNQKVPALVKGKLRIAQGAVLESSEVVVLPPTEAGWQSYLELAPASEMKFTELDQAGEYWWERRIPRDLLSKARTEAEAKAEQGQRGAA
jgi:hypothetical protein